MSAPPTVLLGSLSPDFDLPSTPHGTPAVDRVRLSDYRGRWLILMFYPRDFSLVCPTELAAMSAKIDEFHKHGAEVVGVSTDSVASHNRWIAMPRSQGGLGGLDFPLASDEDGEVSRSFGVYIPWQRVSLRGLFIIDPNGVIQYQVVHNVSVGRRTEDVLRVLAALQTGGLCCEGWTPEKSKTIDPTRVLAPGRVFSHYRIEESLGSGSFAEVYKAIDLTLERPVALKMFRPSAKGWSTAALAEARVAASLSHPNVATIYAVDDDEGASVIAMEYVPGRTLANLIADGPLPGELAGSIVRQVASALADAHDRGIVHGDLKPGNILVTEDEVVKVVDFGLSRRLLATTNLEDTIDAEATADRENSGLSGTPAYMSPEQARGERPGIESDVYSLGLVLYEMLTGRKALQGSNVLAILREIEKLEGASLAEEVAAPFDGLLREMLAKSPVDRAVTMCDVAHRLADEDGSVNNRLVESLS